MGKYDQIDKVYFSDKERFAELVTVGVFHNRLVMHKEDLEEQKALYPSARSDSGSIERDLFFACRKYGIMCGVEIEIKADYKMPVRIMTYDCGEYEKQLAEIERFHDEKKDLVGQEEFKSKLKRSDFILPVINLVLYLGVGRWHGRRTLREMFQLPDQYKAYIGDRLQNYTYSCCAPLSLT